MKTKLEPDFKKTVFDSSRLTILGVLMTMLVSGCPFLIKNLHPYLTSYFWLTKRQNLELDDYSSLILEQVCLLAGMMVGVVLFNKIQINIKLLMLVATVIQITGTITALFNVKNVRAAGLLYSSVFAFGSGIDLMLCLQCLWEYFPKYRG